MKKIMFNDHYGLTQAVLNRSKTMTRRIISNEEAIYSLNEQEYMNQLCIDKRFCEKYSRYQIGEVVAVAQNYNIAFNGNGIEIVWENDRHKCAIETQGWTNKMFVCADEMPHHIKITDIKVARLQDISDEDCLREGVYYCTEPPKFHESDHYCPWPPTVTPYKWATDNFKFFCNPQFAFAYLIDKVSGKGTWDSNPWVFVYEFELVK